MQKKPSVRRFQTPKPRVKRQHRLASAFATALNFVVIVAIMAPTDCRSAEDSNTQELQNRDLGRFVFAGFVAGRQKLTTGKFAIEGTLKESHQEWGEISGEVKVFCAFDFNRRILRFDRSEPTRQSSNPDASPVSPKDWIPGTRGGNFVLLEDSMIVHPLGHNNISVLPISRTPPPWVRAFDVRCLGAGHQLDLDKGATFNSIISIYERQLANFPVTATFDSEGVYRVDMTIMDKHSGTPIALRTAWYDSSKDYFPVKLQVRECRGYGIEGDSKSEPIWGSPSQHQTIKPQQISDVWVPEKVVLTSDGGNKVETLNFIWESVNSEINDTVFTPDGFPLDGVDSVVDHRLGRLIVTKQYNQPQHLEKPGATQHTSWRWKLILGNAVFVAILLAFYLPPRRDRSAPG